MQTKLSDGSVMVCGVLPKDAEYKTVGQNNSSLTKFSVKVGERINPDASENAKPIADNLYEELQKNKVEVIYDDREGVRAGQMFADADLLGVPIRVVVSPRNLQEGKLEISTRDKSVKQMVDIADGLEYILGLKRTLFGAINV